MQKTEMERLYQPIADAIVEMIPEDWSRVLLYAQVNEESAIVFFYYYPQGSDTPEYSLDIAAKWDVPPRQYNELEKRLYGLFTELWRDFMAQGHRPWTNLTLVLDNGGDISVNYDYSDKENCDSYEDLVLWRKKHLIQR